jgi:adenine-specific DNA-methyltransferase
MYPRLFLARNLLKSDGVIFISIDDNEVHNLKEICNEIFGEENFLAQIIWQRAFSPVNLKKTFSPNHDFILCYSKNIEKVDIKGLKRDETSINRYKNPDNDSRGPWTSGDLSVGPIIQEKVYEITTPSGRKVLPPSGYCWRVSIDKFESLKKEDRIWFGEKGDNVPRLKRFFSDVSDKITPMTIWTRDEVGDSQSASRHLKQLFDGATYFDYPKPVKLIERFLDLVVDSNDIVMDFFLGSGTTGEAVFNYNSANNSNVKFIGVQLPEKTNEKSSAFKDGYNFLSDITLERLKRNISDKGYGIRKYVLSKSNFNIWNGNIEYDNLSNMLENSITNLDSESNDNDILTEIILKSGFKLTVPIEEITFAEKKVFSIENGAMIVCLNKELDKEIIREIAKLEPVRVVCLDLGFKERDELKTNAVQIMKSFGIDDFRTI